VEAKTVALVWLVLPLSLLSFFVSLLLLVFVVAASILHNRVDSLGLHFAVLQGMLNVHAFSEQLPHHLQAVYSPSPADVALPTLRRLALGENHHA
jgi:hypothetical protein